jgi:hypothetical protein
VSSLDFHRSTALPFSQLKCPEGSCGYASNRYEPFLDLSLELGKGVSSVTKALAQFQVCLSAALPAALPTALPACVVSRLFNWVI